MLPGMDRPTYLHHLRGELDAFAACLGGDLTIPVEHCGDWTLYDLADHVGNQNMWVVKAVTEGHGDHTGTPPPREPAALEAWFAGTAARLLETLDTDPATPAWTFIAPHTVGFWQRRRALETLIHRWDAQCALGTPEPLDAALAADGVAEVIDTMLPRMIARGRTAGPARAVTLTGSDAGASWVLGPGEPVAEIRGPVADLLLSLWGRLPADAPSLTWSGDVEAGREVMRGPLVP